MVGDQSSAGIRYPYSPSWHDRLQIALERSKLPLGYFYLGAWLLPLGMITGLTWWHGIYLVGVFPLFHATLWGTSILALGLLHYLDHSAIASLQAFRPVLDVCEEDYSILQYRLTHLPAKKTLLIAVLGALVGVGEILMLPEDEVQGLKLFTTPLARVVEMAMYVFGWIFFGTLIYHTIHQLRVVQHIYQHCTRVNLFRLDPLYSFSWLTARTAL